MTPEQRLLGLAARIPSDDCSGIAEALSGPIDWRVVVDRALHEGIAPLLHAHLTRHPSSRDVVPESTRRALVNAYRTTWARNAALIRHWIDVTALLRAADISCLTHKGIALIHTVYPDPALRPMADIDLLVRPEDSGRAVDILRAAGFRTAGGAFDELSRFRSFALLMRESVHVDLHWDLADYVRFRGIVRIDHEGIWRRARSVDAGGTEMRTLAPEDTLLHLVVHLTLGSEFGRLIWLADIDALLRTEGAGFDWDRALAEADRWRVRSLLGCVLTIVHASLGTPVPRDVSTRLRPGRVRASLLRRLIGAPRPPTLEAPVPEVRAYLAETILMDRMRDIVRVTWRSLFPSVAWVRQHYDVTSPWRIALRRLGHPLRVGYLALRGVS